MAALITIVLWVLFGALAGWIASKIMGRDNSMGPIANVVVGIVGAAIGGWIFRRFFGGSDNLNLLWNLLISVGGACVFLFIVGIIRRIFR